ncbi:hypothetical protein PIB30_086684 [Stylosanthes scabra]|uniref:Peptidase A1 domain-containing protein n=1 Tax=Stylosanthes scabra TaxID=79078 RepID=A0ABU6XS89_9FABA|nr:hypothetical protein [Stylosanthes scabra]
MGNTGANRFQMAVIVVGMLMMKLSFGDAARTGGVVGFSTELIPRSSPLSPLYNPSRSKYEDLKDAIQRSKKRASKIEAPLRPGGLEYVMRVSIGTPPVELLGIADTGSDLIWTQCLPCTDCYDQTLPFYNPRRSSSFKTISCSSDKCSELPSRGSGCDNKNVCSYQYGYGDNSVTSGDLATERFTIGSGRNSAVPNIAFGCSHTARGTFDKSQNGLIGLGRGALSLVSQLGGSARKFSYCLAPISANSTTKISFGSDALVSGSKVVTTPLITDPSQDTFYFLSLESLSIGNSKNIIPFQASDGGNVIIDSGTVLTLLPQDVVDQLVSDLDKSIRLPKVDDPTQELSLCYKVEGSDFESELPKITAHFKGADVVLNPINTFLEVAQGVVCLGIVPSEQLSIIGNVAQVNFLVGYDLDAQTLSFKPTDCTKQD